MDQPSNLCPDEKTKKTNFFIRLKNYISSKIRSSQKYDVSSTSKKEISIISYDQHSFEEIEKHCDHEGLKVDKKVLDSLKKVLNKKISDNTSQKIELLEIVEKTFTRQLDIFETLVKNTEFQNDKNALDNSKKHMGKNIAYKNLENDCINEIIQNLVLVLSRSLPDSEKHIYEITKKEPEKLSTTEEDSNDATTSLLNTDAKQIDVQIIRKP